MRFDLHPWPSDESDWFGCSPATRWSSLCIPNGAEEKWERAAVDHTDTTLQGILQEREKRSKEKARERHVCDCHNYYCW
jgi:hypothetical protein